MQLWGRDPLGGSLISDEPACLLLSPRLSQGESRCPWSLRPSDPPSLLFSGITPSHSSLGWEACGGGGETTHAHSTFCLALSRTDSRHGSNLAKVPCKGCGEGKVTPYFGVLSLKCRDNLGLRCFCFVRQPSVQTSLAPQGLQCQVPALGMGPCFHSPHTTKHFARFQEESHS